MKATSCGLEIEVEISEIELARLENNPLTGTLRHRIDEEEKNLQLQIVQDPKQREVISVSQNPSDCYLGNANTVQFVLSQEFYNSLKENKYFGERFYGATGKLEIKVK